MAVNKVVFDGETVIDLTEDTVTEETLLEGVTAHNAAGEAIVGTYAASGNSGKTLEFMNSETDLAAKGFFVGGALEDAGYTLSEDIAFDGCQAIYDGSVVEWYLHYTLNKTYDTLQGNASKGVVLGVVDASASEFGDLFMPSVSYFDNTLMVIPLEAFCYVEYDDPCQPASGLAAAESWGATLVCSRAISGIQGEITVFPPKGYCYTGARLVIRGRYMSAFALGGGV